MTFAPREQRSFDAVSTSPREAREFVGATLRHRGAPAPMIMDYQLAVSELATNAIEHGDGSALMVFVELTDPLWWEVGVVGGITNGHSEVLRPDSWIVADALQSSGRGLGIIKQLMDEIVADNSDGAVTIRCRRRRGE